MGPPLSPEELGKQLWALNCATLAELAGEWLPRRGWLHGKRLCRHATEW